jgi:hypothetical protein
MLVTSCKKASSVLSRVSTGENTCRIQQQHEDIFKVSLVKKIEHTDSQPFIQVSTWKGTRNSKGKHLL